MSSWNNPSLIGSGSAFTATPGGRSWNWLLGLCRALNVSVQLVDEELVAVLPIDSSQPDELQKLIASGAPTLHGALSTAIQTRHSQFAAIGALQIVCAPVMSNGSVAGALVIGRAGSPPGQGVDISRARLERVALWLTAAVERHLLSQAVPAGNLLPLIRVLDSAVEKGSDRDLVSVFAEALAVWHDIEVVGYVETGPGIFVREVSLAGRTHVARPLVLPPAAVPPALQLTRMPRADIEGPAPVSTQDVVVTTLSRRQGSISWLLMLSGSLDSCETQLLSNYVAVLDVSMARAIEASKGAITGALSRLLISGDGNPRTITGAALEELRHRLNASAVLLTVEAEDGPTLLRVTSPPDLAANSAEGPNPQRLTISRREAGEYAMTLALTRANGPQFTPLEHHVAQAAAAVLAVWSRRVAAGSNDQSVPSFGETIEHLAKEALERGTVVTAVVISAGQVSGVPRTEKWVEEIRRRMRQSDAVGLLPAGEIGLLLHDTTAAHAKAVTRRLQSALGGIADAESAAIKAIGFATRMPGQGVADGIVRDARLNAMNHSNGDSQTGIM